MDLKNLIVALFLSGTSLSFPAWAGGGIDIGSGGDFIICKASSDNPFEGLYSLDELLTYSESDPLRKVQSYEQSLEKIENLLKTHLPGLADPFEEYRRLLFNEDPSKSRVWEKSPFGLIDLKDEEIGSERSIPENCRVDGQIKVIQAAIRLSREFTGIRSKTIYSYMPEAIEKVKTDRPEQVSMLLVHEWLWDYSTQLRVLRQVNRFLHSERILSLSTEQVRETLLEMGFSLPPEGMEVFSKNWCQKQDHFKERFKYPDFGTLGYYSIRLRQRNCDSERGCSPWREREDPFLNGIAKGFLSIKSDLSKIWMYPNGRKKDEPFLTCEVSDEGLLKCTPIFQYHIGEGQALSESEGVVSDQCVQITQLYTQDVWGRNPEEKSQVQYEAAIFILRSETP